MSLAVQDAAQTAARTAYGRLLAAVVKQARGLAEAEDALAEAFRLALETWPRDGIPGQPDAWLLTVARRRAANARRHAAVRSAAEPALAWLAAAREERGEFPDDRLALLFICAHPAIDPAIRTPLMLQTVLGLDAAAIAAAFLVAPAAMAQRLVRAKAKIRNAGIPFGLPEPAELPGRLQAVLEAVFAAYGAGWDESGETGSLAGEALFLGRLLAELLPGEPEALGLAALLLHCEGRRSARRDGNGQYVPLSDQDTHRWSAPMIAEAEGLLRAASRLGRPGRFQFEAAIQSAHAARALLGSTPWHAIVDLYAKLLTVAPTLGAAVAHASALGKAISPEAALAALDALTEQALTYQPYWAARAHWAARAGSAEAAESYARAIALCGDPVVRRFLQGRAVELSGA